jgi:DNA-binding NarL/FixJ family response regulator
MMHGIKQNQISIVIADDHSFFREGLAKVLSMTGMVQIIGEASNGQELVELAERLDPDLLIVDIGMPILNGIDAVKQIRELGIRARVIALSMHSEDAIMIRMLEAGAMGYLDKNTTKEELFAAIDSVVVHNRVYFPASTNLHMLDLLSTSTYKPYPENSLTFTDRELEVIQLVCREFSNKEIADQLHLSQRTIESHRVRIMERMNVKSVAGLVAYAYSKGLISKD